MASRLTFFQYTKNLLGIFETDFTLHFHLLKEEAAFKQTSAQGHLSFVCLLGFYLHFSYIRMINPNAVCKSGMSLEIHYLTLCGFLLIKINGTGDETNLNLLSIYVH